MSNDERGTGLPPHRPISSEPSDAVDDERHHANRHHQQQQPNVLAQFLHDYQHGMMPFDSSWQALPSDPLANTNQASQPLLSSLPPSFTHEASQSSVSILDASFVHNPSAAGHPTSVTSPAGSPSDHSMLPMTNAPPYIPSQPSLYSHIASASPNDPAVASFSIPMPHYWHPPAPSSPSPSSTSSHLSSKRIRPVRPAPKRIDGLDGAASSPSVATSSLPPYARGRARTTSHTSSLSISSTPTTTTFTSEEPAGLVTPATSNDVALAAPAAAPPSATEKLSPIYLYPPIVATTSESTAWNRHRRRSSDETEGMAAVDQAKPASFATSHRDQEDTSYPLPGPSTAGRADAAAAAAQTKAVVAACDFCRTRKLRCDEGQPCRHCERRQRACVYSDEARERKRKRIETAALRAHQRARDEGEEE